MCADAVAGIPVRILVEGIVLQGGDVDDVAGGGPGESKAEKDPEEQKQIGQG
jgi:hypothetical protein